MQRIDIDPTHEYQGYKIRPGKPFPFGASLVPGGVNFSVFSRHANYCILVILKKGAAEPCRDSLSRDVHQGVYRKAGLGGIPNRQCLHHDRVRPRR